MELRLDRHPPDSKKISDRRILARLSDPVIREENALPGIAAGHVAVEAPAPGRDPARRLGRGVTRQADAFVFRPVPRRRGVRVMAGHAAQRSIAALVAGGLHQADGLIPNDLDVVRPDGVRRRPVGMAVAITARLHQAAGGPSLRTEPHGQVGFSATRRRDVYTRRAVAAFA